jgi:Protein of unknown function (DUF3591)/Bromodomain
LFLLYQGGGDRPARRKRGGEAQEASRLSSKNNDRLPRLEGPNRTTTVMDWVGKIPKKTQKDRAEKEIIDVLPEGVTEMLHPKVHGPFIGEIEQGTTLTGLVSNLFVAPLFKHEPESTDFLMILSPMGGASRPGQREAMGIVLRELPESVFTVGQTEPRVRVHAPNTQGEKSFVGPFVSYQIASVLRRSQEKDGHGLRFDELQDRVLPSSELPPNALRQRLKNVALYDKNTQIWTTKQIGCDDYPGVDALAKSISPEGVATYESACAARRRLVDLGVQQLLEKGSHTVVSVGVTMVYLVGQLNSASDCYRKTKRLRDLSKSTVSKVKTMALQIKFYEKATEELEELYKVLRQKHEVAQFVYEELQLAPWHLTGEFIDVHKQSEGTGMMKLTGLGDPSGQGEGFSFLREVDSKPSKSVGNSALNAEIKKITGTDDDLRKLTMKQMAALLRSYGMGQKQIDTLKRWDRVHVIRDLSTKAASDGIGDGLERFARGEKMKLSEQKQMYTERIQVIWKRQIAALSAAGDRAIGSSDVAGADAENDVPGSDAILKKDADKDDSDSDSSDDDLAAEFEEDMMGGSEANQLVAAHAGGNEREGGLGQLRAVTQNQDLTKDAREFALLKKQREEERAAQQGLQSARPTGNEVNTNGPKIGKDRKVIRKKITKTYPDGRQTITFKYILHPQEVGNIISRLDSNGENNSPHNKEFKHEHGEDENPPGHAMFEDEDDFEYSSKGRHHGGTRRRGTVKMRRGAAAGRVTPRGAGGGTVARSLTLGGKLKSKTSKEERIKKRKREEEELEVYSISAKRKGTSNRRERGSIRDRRPHVIFAEKLEQIRNAVEARPYAGPFLKPVNRRLIPRYYEVISHPIDLSAIRDKIKRYVQFVLFLWKR